MAAHPDDLDLFDLAHGEAFPGDGDVRHHVAGCAACRDEVERLRAHSVASTVRAFESVSPRPTALSAALTTAPPDPSPGQMWRAAWEKTTQIVLVIGADDDRTLIAAPIADAAAADDSSVLLGADLLGWATAVITAASAQIPSRVLERYLGEVSRPVLDRVREVAFADEPGDDLPIMDPADERWTLRLALHARMASLSTARWVPDAESADDARSALSRHWGTPASLARDIGVSPGVARGLLVGERQLSDEQRQIVEQILGHPIAPQLPDQDLVWALDHPSVRPLWQARAAKAGVTDDPAFRWQTYTHLNFAIAARTTGGLSGRERTLAKVKQVLDDRA